MKDKEKPPFPEQRNFAPLRVKDMLVHFIGDKEFLQPQPFRKEKEARHSRAC
jgi:hypothetical protein